MDRKEALAELIAKVEAGKPAKVETWFAALGVEYYLARDAAGGSLDAAKALHEAVLPGWGWTIQKEAMAYVYGSIGEFAGSSSSEARAWLLAILKVLHGMEKDT